MIDIKLFKDDKKILWFSIEENKVFSFINENNGEMFDLTKDESHSFNWNKKEDANNILISFNDDEKYLYKIIKQDEETLTLKRKEKNSKEIIEVVWVKENDGEVLLNSFNNKTVYDRVDGICLLSTSLTLLIFFSILFKTFPFFDIGYFYSTLFAFVTILLLHSKIKKISFFISYKYKRRKVEND